MYPSSLQETKKDFVSAFQLKVKESKKMHHHHHREQSLEKWDTNEEFCQWRQIHYLKSSLTSHVGECRQRLTAPHFRLVVVAVAVQK